MLLLAKYMYYSMIEFAGSIARHVGAEREGEGKGEGGELESLCLRLFGGQLFQ